MTKRERIHRKRVLRLYNAGYGIELAMLRVWRRHRLDADTAMRIEALVRARLRRQHRKAA